MFCTKNEHQRQYQPVWSKQVYLINVLIRFVSLYTAKGQKLGPDWFTSRTCLFDWNTMAGRTRLLQKDRWLPVMAVQSVGRQRYYCAWGLNVVLKATAPACMMLLAHHLRSHEVQNHINLELFGIWYRCLLDLPCLQVKISSTIIKGAF